MMKPNTLRWSLAIGGGVAAGMFLLNHPSSPDQYKPDSNRAAYTTYDPDAYTLHESIGLSLAFGSMAAIGAGVLLNTEAGNPTPPGQPTSPKLPTELSVEDYRRRFAQQANEFPPDDMSPVN